MSSSNEGSPGDAVERQSTYYEDTSASLRTASKNTGPQRRASPLFISEGGSRSSSTRSSTPLHRTQQGIAIIPPKVERPWEYQLYEDDIVIAEVLEEIIGQFEVKYIVKFKDGHEATIPQSRLSSYKNADQALVRYEEHIAIEQSSSNESTVRVTTTRRTQPRRRTTTTVQVSNVLSSSSDDELIGTKSATQSSRKARFSKSGRRGRRPRYSKTRDQSSSSEESDIPRSRTAKANTSTRTIRLSAGHRPNYKEILVANEFETDSSSGSIPSKRRRPQVGRPKAANSDRTSDRLPTRTEGTRRSSRVRKSLNEMQELGEDDIPEVTIDKAAKKVIGVKEIFQPLPKDDKFRLRHNHTCATCKEYGSDDEKGPLIFCQGCTDSYHQKCLGPRSHRDHLVTKVGHEDFVLQCRRCVEVARLKDPRATKQGSCHVCDTPGNTSKAFRTRQTLREEQEARENNGGEDPSVKVSQSLINQSDNVLFRCVLCHRASHFQHLPPQQKPDVMLEKIDSDDEQTAQKRFLEYCKDWSCNECTSAPAEIDALVAWKPRDLNKYILGQSVDDLHVDEKEYLVKWKDLSYSKCVWMPGAWVWGVTSPAMRKAFAKRDEMRQPKLSIDDALPEEYLRVDIVFDVEYTNVVKEHDESIDKARVKEVQQALVKFKGLGYEDVVWEEPPNPSNSERWADFESAYNDWVVARYIHIPQQIPLNRYISQLRSQNFEKQLMMRRQPANLTGGELMAYQLEGLNWLYYQWHKQQNAILADEMGLGKTIQVIGFLSTLKLHGCWPFLIVVPNSTCANWRREIKVWAPSLRVVTYFGSAEARRLAYKHELFHGKSKDLNCHIVVTSYDAAQDEEFRKIFRGVVWRGLVVDEGQRLKSDKNLLYGALNALKVPFKLLLTGTPLQNNPRELFNLLQFLDPSIDAQAKEEEYTTLTKENVPRLHELIRPFLLRRTKAQVLDFLPSMAQIIVPVTLTLVQKKLYKSILAKNQELIKSIFGGKTRLRQNDRANLNNILMQLRKCLCHPFVYSRDIEERSTNSVISHRNLVEASSKLQLLEIMLPKLQERGHRVLIFSQFLDMLDMVEDFLDGLGLFYQRLDGSMNSQKKQKRIDEFNAPNSPLFAFLLSTRAGGVGINLATADTVIILDPDFNPHQDIQALSRAHRIGQKKKVLVFQLTTRSTAEEKIMQIGKKKMALDHVLIEKLDAEDDAGMDLESILRHGTEALFGDDTNDIRYDSASVDKLLDRSQIENTSTGKDNSAESQFSFARVWANDKAVMEDSLGEHDSSEHTPDPSVWEKILKEREEEVAAEAATRAQALGRGKRKRQAVDYAKDAFDLPKGSSPQRRRKVSKQADSDTDFQARKDSDVDESEGDITEEVTAEDLDFKGKERKSRSLYGARPSQTRSFRRVNLSSEVAQPGAIPGLPSNADSDPEKRHPCVACQKHHVVGYCPLKLAGVEHCPLCGLAHYGYQRTCPQFNSISECRKMLEALKDSPETSTEIGIAKKFLVGVIGDLQRQQRIEEGRTRSLNEPVAALATTSSYPVATSQPSSSLHVQGTSSTDVYASYRSNPSFTNGNSVSHPGAGGPGMPVINGARNGATLPGEGNPPAHA